MTSTTGTVTLTDFLLARIAEDEAAVWTGRVAEDLRDEPVQYLDYGEVQVSRRRFLAECEAKRRIVRRARRERGRYEQTGGNLGNPIESVVAWETAVRLLALPYADHPDYREEWRQ